MNRSSNRALHVWAGLLALGLLLGVEIVHRSKALDWLEEPWGDLWLRLAGGRAQIERVVLVELDEASLAAYPDDPLVFWSPHFARACAVLQSVGVKTIGLDFQFSASPEQWLAKISGRGSAVARGYDREFREILAGGRVVLAAQQLGPEPLLPAADYLVALPDFDVLGHVGATDLIYDRDATLRQIAAIAPGARAAPADGLKLLSFPMLLALHATGQAATAAAWRFGERNIEAQGPPWKIAFAGPPGTVPRLPMHELLAKDAERNPKVQALAGKVAIIGPAYGGSNDLHLTPYGHGLVNPRLMAGPEIYAQAIEAMLTGQFYEEFPAAGRLALLAFALGLGFWAWLRVAFGRGFLALLGILILVAAVAYELHSRLWTVPVSQMQAAAIALFLSIYGLRFTFEQRLSGRVRAVFSRYVSSDVVATVLETEAMPVLGGREVDMTVLFTDIRNFTTMSERMAPEEVVEMLNQWFERACGVLQEEGGRIDKFIGDAVMVEFGVPQHYPDHARRAVRAALRLAQVAVDFQSWMTNRFAGRGLPPFAIGVGLHSGKAVVGNIGSNQRMEYTAVGDTVNLASRLEGVTKRLSCVVVASRAVVDNAGSGLETGKRETLLVRGRNEPVEVIEIRGLKG